MHITTRIRRAFETLLVQEKWLTAQELDNLKLSTDSKKTLERLLVEQGILSVQEVKTMLLKLRKQAPPFGESSEQITPEKETKKSFGPYRVLSKIAQGGMGAVYKVYHQNLDRVFALKVILDCKEEEGQARFYKEAKTSARLKHQNLVRTIDFGKEGETLYLVMEYIKGKTLEEKIEEGLAIREGVVLLKKALEALHYAHQQSVLHRDLKPANIFVTSEGEPKIGDFGLAREQTQGETKGLTKSGEILGTPSYMPPEQALGEKVKNSADIYAMGVCLFQILTQKLPFESNSVHELFYKIIETPPPVPSKIKKGIHQDLDTIILKALQKNPAKRYQSAKAFAEDLGRFLENRPILARPTSKIEKITQQIKKHRISLSVAFVLFFLFASFIGYSSWEAYSQKKIKITRLHQKIRKLTKKKSYLPERTRKERQKKLQFSLELLKKYESILQMDSQEKKALKGQERLCFRLVGMACQNSQYELARYVARNFLRSSKKKEKSLRKIQKNKKSNNLKTKNVSQNGPKEF